MFNELPPLPWLRAFEASARLGNFTRAAEELALTPSAVSHQVRSLEARLEQQLFTRARRSLSLTRLGQSYLPIVTQAFAALNDSTSGLFGKTQGNTVTLRCLSSLTSLWLLPKMARPLPDVTLRLLSTSWSDDPGGEGIDIDIRYGDGTWSDGEVIPLMQGDVLPVATPELAARGDIASGPLIAVTGVLDSWEHFFTCHLPDRHAPDPAITVDQSLVALELATAGRGFALVAEVFAHPYLQDGRLVPAGDRRIPERLGHHIVLPHGTNPHRPEVAAIIEWLRR
ncbi:LysR family transcriptional regulator [Paracoccus sp. PARArs4]|uniref:LysR family transcriptional regulator n=1 Tax=Paracoccus sp. PARArs4 TaxID=2853442 RepID=UPI0024A6A89F|nr:LysR family transcriptional regulator [Paracoccus sp. PARArs4]